MASEDPTLVSYSQTRTYLTCRRKWGFDRLSDRQGFKDYFMLGSLVHKGIELWYLFWDREEVREKLIQEAELQITNYGEQYRSVIEKLRQEAFIYVQNYIDYSEEYDDFTIEDLEQEHIFVTGDAGIKIKIDGLVERDGKLYLLEHKTAKTLDTEHLIVDSQITLYVAVLEKVLKRPVEGIIYNIIRKKIPSRPKINKDGSVSSAMIDTTAEIYLHTLLEVYGERSAFPQKNIDRLNELTAKDNQYFKRLEITKTEEEKEEAINRYLAVANEIKVVKPWLTTDYLRKLISNPTKDCTRCEFMKACALVNKRRNVEKEDLEKVVNEEPSINIIGEEEDLCKEE